MQAATPEFTDALMMALALPFVPVGVATLTPLVLSFGSVFGLFGVLAI